MPKHRKGPPTQLLIEEYQAGSTTPELGKKYGMSHAAIQGRLKRAGIKLRPARARAFYDLHDLTNQAVILYTQHGFSIPTIAERLGGSRSTIQRALAVRGIAMRAHCRNATITIPDSPTILAYMAGLFDGEGNLQFRNRDNGSVGCKLAVYSTTSDVMNWVHKTFGGSLRWDHARTKRRGWKPIGIWEIYRAQDVGRLLSALLPYLIIKRSLALDALRHFEKALHLAFTTNDHPVQSRLAN